MKVALIDKNTNGIKTIIDTLSICRDKQCTEETVNHCLTAKPVPHLSALEFCWFCFLVEGVSVKTRIQQLRHRHFSTMERSTRHILLSEIEPVRPATVDPDVWGKASNGVVDKYFDATGNMSIEDASYLLPMATPTTFYIAGNGRVWFEYLQKRLCPEFVQVEHYLLAKELYKQLVEEIPQFKYAKPCLNCKHCKQCQG